MSTHAEHVLTTLETAGSTSRIAASWRRSAILHGLDPATGDAPEADSMALQSALERDGALVATAGPYLDVLFKAVADVEGGIVLTDRTGLLLATRFGRSLAIWKRRPDHWLGASLSEAKLGTNGCGTCLAEERPVAICGREHFFGELTDCNCYAAPIRGPDGAVAGCLCIVTLRREPRAEALAQMAVKAFARRIESELFAAAFSHAKLVLASKLGRHPGALLAVDRDDMVLGATHQARQLLGLSDAKIEEGVIIHETGCGPADETLAETERKRIERALTRHAGNVTAAAKEIGISRSTFYRKRMSGPP